MKTLRNTKNIQESTIRKVLRNNPTPQELKLWQYLRGNQTGYKFRRQHGIGRYIVDFYCPSKNLVIEIDGSGHLKQKQYDDNRTHFLESQGCKVLRFWNNEITDNTMESVMTVINNELLNL